MNSKMNERTNELMNKYSRNKMHGCKIIIQYTVYAINTDYNQVVIINNLNSYQESFWTI